MNPHSGFNQSRDAAGRSYVFGVCSWNHSSVRALFQGSHGGPEFHNDFASALHSAQQTGGQIVAWASRFTKVHQDLCFDANVPVVRVEDGFVRSIGLGAGYVPAASLAVDARGIYYDSATPSDIEHDLQTLALSSTDEQTGAQIRSLIVNARLSKYNLAKSTTEFTLPVNRPIVLVPGQVSTDASITRMISQTIDLESNECINQQLLRLARMAYPEAFIVYRPHPDVLAQLRRGHVPAAQAMRYADAISSGGDIIPLIERCNRVVTISSLAGFEALLRNKPVTVHGSPFYAGWGLTDDQSLLPRRSKRRTVDELTFIAFERYTKHIDPFTRCQCNIKQLIASLVRLRDSAVHRFRISMLLRVARLIDRGRE